MKAIRDKATGRLLSWWDDHDNSVSATETEPFNAPTIDEVTQEILDISEIDERTFNIRVAQQAGVEPTKGVGDVFLHSNQAALKEALDMDKPRTPDREKTVVGNSIGGFLVSVNLPGRPEPDSNAIATMKVLQDVMVEAGASGTDPIKLSDVQKLLEKGNDR